MAKVITCFETGKCLAEKIKGENPYDFVGSKDMNLYGDLAEMVSLSGDGDYLELGTWRGASATIAATIKQNLNHSSQVFCVDHFKGYNGEYIGPDAAWNMFERYGVLNYVSMFKSPSRPFPYAAVRTYACAFIDADHWGDAPYLDFKAIESMVHRFILMDDYDKTHADLMLCVQRIEEEFSTTWKRLPTNSNSALFERISHGES